jgi:hypothetical protein
MFPVDPFIHRLYSIYHSIHNCSLFELHMEASVKDYLIPYLCSQIGTE